MKKNTLLLLLMFVGTLSAQTTTASYTFDTDKEAWLAAGATPVYDAANYKANVGSIMITSEVNKLISTPKLDITVGTYTFTFFVKGVAGTSIRSQFKEFDNGGAATNGDTFEIPATGGITGGDGGSWFQITQTKEITVAGQVAFRIQNKTEGATFYIDDVKIELADVSGNVLTVNSTGSGIVTKTLNKISYENTDSETLTATPATHWNFGSWSGDLTGSTNPESLLMDADKTVTANFTLDTTFDYAFNFDVDDELEGWSMDPQVTVKSYTGGLVTLSLVADQWSRLNLFDFPIPATTTDPTKYNKVTIVVKNEEATTNQFGIAVGANNETLVFPLLSQAGFQTFEIDLTQFTDWTGEVTSFRIRFADVTNTEKAGRPSVSHDVTIDSIVFSFETPLSTTDNSIENFSMYPNPADNFVTISSASQISKIQLFNIIGKKVLETTELKGNTIDVSNLNSGVYFLKVYNTDNKIATKKLIIN